MSFAFEKTPRISLGCKLVLVRYLQYGNGLLCLAICEKDIQLRKRVKTKRFELDIRYLCVNFVDSILSSFLSLMEA